MKKEIEKYMCKIERALSEDLGESSLEEMKEDLLIKISFYQHERLIHLIVLAITIIVESILFLALFITNNYRLYFPILPLTILLLFYVAHYFFLENSVQKLYKIYDEISGKIKM